MFTHTIKLLALATIFAGSHTLWAQSPLARQTKAEVDSLAQRLAKVHAGQVLMSKRADSLAQAITRMKTPPETPLKTLALEKALLTSQIWAETLQKTQAEEQFLDQALRQKAETLLKNLSADLERLTATINEAKKHNQKQLREQLQQELQLCRQWQEHCHKILASPPTKILIYEVRVEPNDDANALSRKSDFLRDQSDRLERESKRLASRLEELQREKKLRTSMHEFGEEIALFDPSNEGISPGKQTASRADGQSTGAFDTRLSEGSFSSSQLLIALSWPDNISDLSPQDLTDWIKHLQHIKERLRVQADSLRQRATDFEALRQQQQD